MTGRRADIDDLLLQYINGGQANIEFKNLGEFETEFVNILGYESGAKVYLIYCMEKPKVENPALLSLLVSLNSVTARKKYTRIMLR